MNFKIFSHFFLRLKIHESSDFLNRDILQAKKGKIN